MHVHVAEQCVQQRKNMVTASYISAGMQQLHERSGPMSDGGWAGLGLGREGRCRTAPVWGWTEKRLAHRHP